MPDASVSMEQVGTTGAGGGTGSGVNLGRRSLSLRHAVAQSLGLGPMVSTGVLLGLIASPQAGAGVNATFSVLIGTIGCLGLGFAVSLFARRYAGAGAIYEYLARGGSARFGVLAAGIYFVGMLWLGGPSITSGVSDVTQPFLQSDLSIHLSWWVIMLIALALVELVNYLGIRIATRAMLVIVGFGLIPMLILAITIIVKGGAHGNTAAVFNPGTTSIGTAFNGVLIAVTLFTGFESAAALGIPRAVLLSLLGAGAFYVLMSYALTIGYGLHAVAGGAWTNDPAYLNTMASRYVGGWLGTILDIVVILDGLAAMTMFCVVVGHGLFSLARDGLLPKVFARTSRFDTPWVSNLTIVAAAAVGMVVIPLAGYAKTFGLPSDTLALLSLTTTAGSYMVELIYFAVVVVAFRLVYRLGGGPRSWWRYVVVLLGASVPILAYKGSLIPVPSNLGTSVNYVALFYAGGMALLVALWYAYLRRVAPARLDRAAAHVMTAEAQPEASTMPAGVVVSS
jgi:amino acid transporter